MYGKIFDSMYKGTLYGQWEAIVTFQQMIVLCDEDGIIDMTPPAISATTSIPREIIERGIEILQEPDKYSRSPAEEGRRIILIDPERPWGWRIVNHAFYKNLASREDKKKADRDRIAAKRAEEKSSEINDVAECRAMSREVADVAHTDTDTDTDTNTKIKDIGHFEKFWEAYPKKVKRKPSLEVWRRKKLDSLKDRILQDIAMRLSSDRRWIEGYIPDPTTYLNQERWNDEIQKPGKSAEKSGDRTIGIIPKGEHF
jgi:hypothetical protein